MEREQRLHSIIDTRDGNRIIMSNLLGKQSSTLCLELNLIAGVSRYEIRHTANADNWTDFLLLIEAAHEAHVYPSDCYADEEERMVDVKRAAALAAENSHRILKAEFPNID